MKPPFPGKVDFFLALGIACALVAGLLYGIERAESPQARLKRVEADIQADFQAQVKTASHNSAKVARAYMKTGDLGPRENIVRLVLNRNCQLMDWNNSEIMPSRRIISDLCKYPNRRTLQDKNKTYYLIRQETPDLFLVTLIPISIRYKVENSYLPRYMFLGRYASQSHFRNASPGIDLHLRQVDGAMKVFDAEGNFVFCLSVPQPEVFAYPARDAVLLMALGGLLLILTGTYRRLRGKHFRLGGAHVPWVMAYLFGLLGLRMLLFELDLPNAYRPMELFSPTVLAIGDYAPSLGDLLLNVGLLLGIAWIGFREFRRGLSRFYRYALQRPMLAWVLQCVVLTACVLFTGWFFRLTNNVIQHSTIYFEFSNVFSLTGFSYVAFGVLGMFLVALQLLQLELLRFSFHFFRNPGRWIKVGLSAVWLAGLSLALFGDHWLYSACVILGFALSMMVFLRTQRAVVFKLDLLNFLLVLSIFSLLTTVGMVQGMKNRRSEEMLMLANRQSDEHDLITESLFERVVREVEAEAFLLDHTQAEGLSRRLSEQFFASSFKGYEVRIFIYDAQNKLLDKTGDYNPYLFPDSDPSLANTGRPTMTNDLYLVRYHKGLFESIYIGKFELLLRSLGNLLVWVELLPTEIQPNRLYPQLLLDDKVRSKALISSEYDYAVYKEGRLFRKNSGDPFPLFYDGPVLDTLGDVHTQDAVYDHVYEKTGADKVVHVRHTRMHFFDAANLFSFIFYFFILASIILMLPVWLARFFRNPREARQLSLKSRIQVFFLGFAILPLLIVVFFLTPYIRDHIYRDIQQDLLQETQQVVGQIREDYLKLRRNRFTYSAQHSNLRKTLLDKLNATLQSIEKTFFNDINIYSSTGELQMTTQASIYELGLTSRFMNPEVYRRMKSGQVSDAVIEDQIGKVTYFSAFYPIMNDDRRIVGFLNIPSYKNQEKVNAQSLSLLTLLVNIYVFIFLAIGILAVLISNSIIRPLALLSRKIGDTTLGRRNEPVEWDSRDEIGEIIQAYNDMLRKLAVSEQKLAQNEREMAWQEMARQVAHEIKNPLTPMRLSVQHLVRAWESERPQSERLNNLFDKVTKTILVQVESLVNIANSFSQFAKMPEPQRSVFRLQDVVEEVANLYSHDAEVQLKWDVPDKDFYVHSDRDQLSRVLNNLVKNGGQAIEHDAGLVVLRMELMPDNWARITIQDNGKGISEEIRARIFEPRFSTKSSGMGLGLAIVKKIVESAGGRIYFETEVGKGTKFYVELPGADTPA